MEAYFLTFAFFRFKLFTLFQHFFWNVTTVFPILVSSWERELLLKGCGSRCLSAGAADGDVKGADLIYDPSLLCLPCTNQSATSQSHICGGESACLCVSARVCHLNVLPFIDLKTRGFCAPVKPHVEVAARFIRSLHLSTVPPPFFFFFPSPFLLFGGVISVYWVTRFPRVT